MKFFWCPVVELVRMEQMPAPSFSTHLTLSSFHITVTFLGQ